MKYSKSFIFTLCLAFTFAVGDARSGPASLLGPRRSSGGYDLDLAFVIDTTGSMGSYINAAKQHIRQIVNSIHQFGADSVRLALITYRDHKPEDNTYVTDILDFTFFVPIVKAKLENTGAAGGGDRPEAVGDALCDTARLHWRRDAVKIAMMISDAPPHGLDPNIRDRWPRGCPLGRDPCRCTGELARQEITLYTFGGEPSVLPYRDFFTALAEKTGGQYIPLGSAALMPRVITGGVEEELSLEGLMADVTRQVKAEARGGPVNEAELARRIHRAMQAKGVTTKKLRRNNLDLPEPSARAKKWSKMSTLAEIKADFTPTRRPSGREGPRGRPAPGSAAGSASDRFDVAEGGVSLSQVTRLVNRALAREDVARE